MDYCDLGVIFTGHMIDDKNREKPRFPATMHADVTEAIKGEIKNFWCDSDSTLFISSAAKGCDIIALEIAIDLGLKTHVVLPHCLEDFIKGSIGEPDLFCWERRLMKVLNQTNSVTTLPGGNGSQDYAMANAHMVDIALAQCSRHALLAFWNGEGGDAPGGTAHFVKSMNDKGCVKIIDAALMLENHMYDLSCPVSAYD